MVIACAKENSTETSKLMRLNDESVAVRQWVAGPCQAYTSAENIMSRMSLSVFLRLVKKHAPFVKKGAKPSDYCDHCHCLQSGAAKDEPFLTNPVEDFDLYSHT